MILLSLLAAAIAVTDAPPRSFLKGAETRACDATGTTTDVVVCGRKDADTRYRIKPLDDAQYAQQPVRAETGIPGGGTIQAHGTQANVGGFTAPRAMVTLSWPF